MIMNNAEGSSYIFQDTFRMYRENPYTLKKCVRADRLIMLFLRLTKVH